MNKVLSILLTMTMVVSMLMIAVPPPLAEASTPDLGQMNALDALGIDTSVMPEGFDPDSLDNPYGRDTVVLNPVYEMFMTRISTPTSDLELSLYGHNEPLKQAMTNFYSNQKQSQLVEPAFPALVATASAAGNFIGEGTDGSAAGKTGQVVTVGVSAMSKNGGLYLYFTDPVTGEMSSEPKTLLDTDRVIGNTGSRMTEDFTESPILMQNYLHIAAGDFDGDGIDEIAVYVPEQHNSRIEVYKLQTTHATGDDFYVDPSNWVKVWTYYFNESPYVSNMVSLAAEDFNRDGIDDLAITWGYYYGPGENSGSQAVVLYGDNVNMLQKKKHIDLMYGTAPIVRAAFAAGDVTGDNTPDLILGGQLHTDIMDNNLNSRFVAVFTYDGYTDNFLPVAARNFDLFEKKNEQYVHTAMAGHGDKFYSSPACVGNLTAVNMNGIGHAAYIYLDSLLIEFGADGLSIADALDQNPTFNKNMGNPQKYYAEYGVIAGDFTGDSKESLQLMQYYLPAQETITYYRWWWWFPITVDRDYAPELNVLGIFTDDDFMWSWRVPHERFSTSFCKLNTDDDTSLLRYTGVHYVTYTDPRVLAVLASPPYFADLDSPDLSGSYMTSETSYRSSTGSGSGEVTTQTIKAGVYISYQHDFTVPVTGTKLGSFESELAYTYNYTWETATASQLEQSISYSTEAGSDAVAFYSIPVETYVYESYVPRFNEETGELEDEYDVQLMSVNIPHTASVRVLPLETYERIAADYSELPQISGDILTHTVGSPATYPSSSAGFNNAIVYSGDPAGVGFGGGAIEQEIAMTEETANSYTHSHDVDFKIGAGPGDWVFGITVGYQYASGRVDVTTSGSTFTGRINNMPIEAAPFGYSYAWRVFSYEYAGSGSRFPIVSYLVTGVSAPPKLPTDFRQDVDKTTHDSITLSWSYSGPAAGFQLYRYYEFPDGSGSYELAFIPASEPVNVDPVTGARHYEYTDTGLYPYTDYAYQIQVVGIAHPQRSIPSRVHNFRTKTDAGYPDISLTGVTNDRVHVYPDSRHTVGVVINNSGDYTQPAKYQWQKLSKDGWQNIVGATNATYVFEATGLADEGQYRCRVNVIFGSYHISHYSEAFHLDYSKRTPEIRSFTVSDASADNSNIPKIDIAIASAHTNHYYVPSGTVVFEVVGADYRQSFSVAIPQTSSNGVAYASFTLPHALPNGAYEITAFYSGSRVYQSLFSDEPIYYLAGTGSGYVVTLDSSYIYGSAMSPSLHRVEKHEGITVPSEIIGDVTYKVVRYYWSWDWSSWRFRQYEVEVPGFVSGDSVTAYQAGNFTLIASVNNAAVASTEFSVLTRQVTIGIINQQRMAGDPDLSHPDSSILTVDPATPLAYDDSVAGLGLEVKATNTAGTEVEINDQTDPGYYDIIGVPGQASTTSPIFNNYFITYESGTYILTGPVFSVTGEALLLNNKVVGTIELLIPEGNDNQGWTTKYAPGTNLVFLARPNTGYDVKTWIIMDGNTGDVIGTAGSSSTLHYTMRSQPITVTVEFEVAQSRLEYRVVGEGTVECTSSTVFQSGDVAMQGAEFTFKAIPADGYHFVEWQLHEIGKTPTDPEGVPDEDGSNSCEITMGASDTVLYAVFARDSYQLTLQGDLQGSYLKDADIGQEIQIVYSGDFITGDREVTVVPRPGYAVVDGAVWTHNGQPVSEGVSPDNQLYTFTMLGDTVIAVQTEVGHFDIDLLIEGPGDSENTVVVMVNGIQVDPDNLTDIAGGSSVQFTAVPAYGYLFDKWIVGTDVSYSATLSITALGGDLEVRAVFKDNAAYTVSVAHGLRGNVDYSLNGSELTPISSGEQFGVFAGDEVVVTATPEINFMVEHWWVNGVLEQTTAKTRTFADIDSDLDIEVVFGAQTYSTVTYEAHTGGSIVSATSDGVSFASGSNSVGNGTVLEFVAAPDDGKMIEQWQVDGSVVVGEYSQPLVDTTFTIPALSGSIHVEVSFQDIIIHGVEITDLHTTTTMVCVPESAKVSDEEVHQGTQVIFTVTAEDGYAVSSVSVIGNVGGDGLNGFDSITKQADGSWICVVGAATADLAVSAQAKELYTVTVPTVPVGGSITLGTGEAIEGEIVTVQATPASGYQFSGWTVTADEPGIDVDVDDSKGALTHFTMPASNVTVSATFTATGPVGPIGPIGPPSPPPSDPEGDITETVSADGTTVTLTVTLTAAVDDAGRASVVVDDELLAELAARAKTYEDAGQNVVIEIKIDVPPGTEAVDVTISADAFAELEATDNTSLLVDTGVAEVVFDPETLALIGGAAGGDVSLTTEQVDHSDLPAEVRETVGDRPVYRFGVKKGNVTVSDFGDGYVYVRLPYTLRPGEDENAIVVYYINDAGDLITVRGQYDAATGTVVFRTSHFSEFTIGYNEVSFVDVATGAWYHDAITFMAAREMVRGIGGGRFAPAGHVIRADFLIMVMNAFGVQVQHDLKENFSDAGDRYYTPYLATAKALGLVEGVGNNLYLPEATISRQDMFVILYRILRHMGELPVASGNGALADFDDAGDIAGYAVEAMQLFVAADVVRGDGSKLEPGATSTRAQAVQVLYNLLTRF